TRAKGGEGARAERSQTPPGPFTRVLDACPEIGAAAAGGSDTAPDHHARAPPVALLRASHDRGARLGLSHPHWERQFPGKHLGSHRAAPRRLPRLAAEPRAEAPPLPRVAGARAGD